MKGEGWSREGEGKGGWREGKRGGREGRRGRREGEGEEGRRGREKEGEVGSEGERYRCLNFMKSMVSVSVLNVKLRVLYSGNLLYISCMRASYKSYYNLLEQDVVMCVPFALERQYQIITVTSPFSQ